MIGVVKAAEEGLGNGRLAKATSIVPKVAQDATEQERMAQPLDEREQQIRGLP